MSRANTPFDYCVSPTPTPNPPVTALTPFVACWNLLGFFWPPPLSFFFLHQRFSHIKFLLFWAQNSVPCSFPVLNLGRGALFATLLFFFFPPLVLLHFFAPGPRVSCCRVLQGHGEPFLSGCPRAFSCGVVPLPLQDPRCVLC